MEGNLELVDGGRFHRDAEVARFTAERPLAAPHVTVEQRFTIQLAVQASPDTADVPFGEGFEVIRVRVMKAVNWVAACVAQPGELL